MSIAIISNMKNFNIPIAIIIASIIISTSLIYSSTRDPITNCMKLILDYSNNKSNYIVKKAASRCSGAR
tara:strand:- start:1 stop:207 length:207 start_codon:yes stop_codon:yes gene_type:complete